MRSKILKSLFFMIVFVSIFTIKVDATPTNTNFKDDIFYQAIINNLNKYGYNGIRDREENYRVTEEELKSITYLNIGNGIEDFEKVHNLDGLEYLTSLETLVISYPKIQNIDISKNVKLKDITIINANSLKNIDFSNNVELKRINLAYTHLVNLNLSNCPKLEYLEMGAGSVSDSLIKELDLSNCKELKHLGISGNKFEFLDLSNNTNLDYVRITSGTLKKIILPENSKIRTLTLFDNEIEKMEDIINFETANNLLTLYIQDNYIEDFQMVYEKENITDKNLEPQGKEAKEPINFKDAEVTDIYNNSEDTESFPNEKLLTSIIVIVTILIYAIPIGIVIYFFLQMYKIIKSTLKNYENDLSDNEEPLEYVIKNYNMDDDQDLSGGEDEDLSGRDDDKRL